MSDSEHIPLIPTSRPTIGEIELNAIKEVFQSRWLGTGGLTRRFERQLSEFLGVRHVVAVNSGTAALHIALEALGIGPGDEVVVPSMTFVSTIQAIIASGAKPVFCEVKANDVQIDIEDALVRAGPRTRAILPVHYGGASCDIELLKEQCRSRGMYLVEDAAHALGSFYRGHALGTFGDVGCFSFDPIKNITCGTGGAAVTNDPNVARRLGSLSNVGMREDSWTRLVTRARGELQVVGPGYRYRMVDLNAAIGISQLPRAGAFIKRKRAIAGHYDEEFSRLSGLRLLERRLEDIFPFHYAVRVLSGRRNALANHLRQSGIGTTVHFAPNHQHDAFSEFACDLPVTEQLHRELLTLPLYVDMSERDLEHVISQVKGFFEGKPPRAPDR